ncbi:hypothetical protein GIB67_000540, partial [Kingdonia uniflora]
AIFQRYPRPDKEYQSFSLIYSDRSLDLICKDKDDAEVWFVGLKALISRVNYRKWRSESRSDETSSDGPSSHHTRRNSPSVVPCGIHDIFQKDLGDTQRISLPYESTVQSGFGKAFSDVMSYTAAARGSTSAESVAHSFASLSSAGVDISNSRGSAVDAVRVSLSSAVSSNSQGSGHEELDALGDVFIWGEAISEGMLGGGVHRVGTSSGPKVDVLLPKALESTVVLDVQNISCGGRHAVLVTKQGEVFSWGEEYGGRLGHGVEADVLYPKLIETLTGMNFEHVACGEYHTCAVTFSGDLYTWGDGTHKFGLLGHGSDASHWIPKQVCGQMDGLHVSFISCGPWHTAAVTSSGQLFTFGDGTFGALGHGDRNSTSVPRKVESLKDLRTVRVACGIWHSAAVVETVDGPSSDSGDSSSSGNLFTWGDGDKSRLGHGDKEPRLVPTRVASLIDVNFCQVACGNNITTALTTSGRVYTMGSNAYGQLGDPGADGNLPTCIEGKISNSFIEEIACGSYHVAILTSKTEVYTWGKGTNGRLGHGDDNDRYTPTLVVSLKDKQVKSIACGSNFTAVICLHKWVSSADNSICSGCRNIFGFRRKRHNCYNCGLVFCKACSTKKSVKAALAPNINKPYRVCDDCFVKLKKAMESGSAPLIAKNRNANMYHNSNDVTEKEVTLDSRLNRQMSRLSSVESLKYADNGHVQRNSHLVPIPSGGSQWGSFYSSKLSTSIVGSSKKIFSASVPGSRTVSRATSPISRKPSPPCFIVPLPTDTNITSPKAIADDSKHTIENLSQDIIKLTTQVEDLTCKSKLLEIDLERTTRQLKETTAIAGDETAKCKAAKEVIKSLTAQLKDMAERVPEESRRSSRSGSIAEQSTSCLLRLSPADNHLSGLSSSKSESNGHLAANSLSHNKTKVQTEQAAEWVVQDEPGVYITLSSLSGGGKNLRRIRFRCRFFQGMLENFVDN